MKQIATIAWILLAFMTCAAVVQQAGRDRVLKIDAVALIDHQKEIEGNVDFQHQHGRYTYLFTSTANVDAFKANPSKYEIQLGGACVRMGPLSGEGSAKLFAVHDGRLYIFASEQCRRSFLAAPESFLDRDDETPATTEESVRAGRALLERAVNGIGGAARLDALTTYRETRSRETESGGKNYIVTDTLTLRLPDDVCSVNCWSEQCWGNVATADAAWMTSSGGESEAMVESQRIALMRSAGRHPLMLLRNRDKRGTIVTSEGAKRTINIEGEGAVVVELFTLHRDGATTTLGLDRNDRLRWLSYVGRGSSLEIGRIERVYSAFHDVSGLTLPGRVHVFFEGKPSANESGAFAAQKVNDEADRVVFERKP